LKFDIQEDWKKVIEHSDPDFLNQVRDAGDLKKVSRIKEWDDFTVQASRWVLEKQNPDLVLLHLINLDLVQHATGTHSSETRAELAATDRRISRILSSIDPARTTVFIAGDHGFADYGRILHIRALLARNHLDEKVWTQSEGGQVALHLRGVSGRKKLGARLLKVLHENEKGLYRVLSRADLDGLHAYPQAFCALETMPGTIFDDRPSDRLLESTGHTAGAHGYLPDRPEMQTGLIIWGKGVTSGSEIEDARVIDIAPTIAGIMGFAMPESHGLSLSAWLSAGPISQTPH
jgi:predicted AlkP superfamily pyrophosphatase or phosphodiesterase